MTLLAAYNFDEATGTTVTDRTGNGHTLAFEAGPGAEPTWGAGHTLGGLHGAAVASGGGAGVAWVGPTAAATILGWANLDSALSGDQSMFGFFAASGDTQFAIWVNRSGFGTSGVVQGNARVGGLVQQPDSVANSTLVGAWHHFALTWDGSFAILYRDAVAVSTVDLTGRGTALLGESTRFSVGGGDSFHATIDDVRVYDVALTAAQIAADMATPVAAAGGATYTLGGGASSASSATGAVLARRTLAGAASSGSSATGGLASSGPTPLPIGGSAISATLTAGVIAARQLLAGVASSATSALGALGLAAGPKVYPLGGSAISLSSTTGRVDYPNSAPTDFSFTVSGPYGHPLTLTGPRSDSA